MAEQSSLEGGSARADLSPASRSQPPRELDLVGPPDPEYPALRDLLLGLTTPGGTMHIFKENCVDLAAELGEALRMAALGRACEANGLAGFGDGGAMWFQPPADLIAEHARAESQPVSGWRPITDEIKDGRFVLARVGQIEADSRWEHLSGRCFVIRHEGQTASSYNLGWSVYPGLGGAPDQWFEGWLPMPDQEGSATGDRLADERSVHAEPPLPSPDQPLSGGGDNG